MMQRALVIAGIWLTACGPKGEPAKTAEPAGPAPAAEPVPSAAPAATSAAPMVEAAPAPAAPVAEAKPATPSIHEVCFEMCDKVKAKCPKNAFDACRVN